MVAHADHKLCEDPLTMLAGLILSFFLSQLLLEIIKEFLGFSKVRTHPCQNIHPKNKVVQRKINVRLPVVRLPYQTSSRLPEILCIVSK